MLAKRIIACLDVKDGAVVKGTQFRNHQIVGDIIDLAKYYSIQGADELVFYDITASAEQRTIDKKWISKVAENIDIPFCVAGGIRTIEDAANILAYGADKISINSPALINPDFISQMADKFGQQCVVIGIDSWFDQASNSYLVKQFTGNEKTTITTTWQTLDWLIKVQQKGAGEIVLNMMNQDGVKNGYDITQLQLIGNKCQVPLIASGGAGKMEDFFNVFTQTKVTGALAASVFHQKLIEIKQLKSFLQENGVEVRIC